MVLAQELPVEARLKSRGVEYELVGHERTYTARAEASVLGIPADAVLKVVVVRANGDYALAVLPASCSLNMHRLAHAAKDRSVRLVSEDEVAERFPGNELGALPPVPSLFGVKGYVDAAVLEHDQVAFADGRQVESIIASPRRLFWGEDVIVAAISRDLTKSWFFQGDAVSRQAQFARTRS